MSIHDLDQALTNLVSDLVRETEGVKAAVLFGSYATGQAGDASDVDLLVATEKEWEDGIEVSHELIDGWTVELTFVGRATLEADAREGNPFALSALKHGKVLHDDGTWRRIQAVRAPCVSRRCIARI